ncbi:uncharacterized protein V3H82_014837 [Fundulus diaphanus]
MLSILAFPSVPITADIVEGSSELTDNFKANSGWDILWRTYKKELCVGRVTEHGSSREVIA